MAKLAQQKPDLKAIFKAELAKRARRLAPPKTPHVCQVRCVACRWYEPGKCTKGSEYSARFDTTKLAECKDVEGAAWRECEDYENEEKYSKRTRREMAAKY